MMTNPLLKIKHKTQKQLHEEAQHDIGKYIENSHRIVREVEEQYGVKFTYGTRQGGEIEPLGAPTSSASPGLAEKP
jgi:hypothetical protein